MGSSARSWPTPVMTSSSHATATDAGIWDGDWPKGIAEGLDKLAKGFGTFGLYVGDDGLIYGC